MTQEVIDCVIEIGCCQKAPKGLQIADRNGVPDFHDNTAGVDEIVGMY